jgi:hypothetical protein
VGGPRGEAIRSALRLSSVSVSRHWRRSARRVGRLDAIADHAGRRSGLVVFGKLYARTHLQADRWYKLGRELMYGRLEDENRSTACAGWCSRRTTLRLFRDNGLPPRPLRCRRAHPEREYRWSPSSSTAPPRWEKQK